MIDHSKTFWHASFDPLPVGTTLRPEPEYEMRWHAESAGRILEDLRPANALAHRDAVFMCDNAQDCDNAGAHCEWLFRVQPDARVERHDMDWATRLDGMVSDGVSPDEPEVLRLAANYWNGVPSELPVWEYLTPKATILAMEPY